MGTDIGVLPTSGPIRTDVAFLVAQAMTPRQPMDFPPLPTCLTLKGIPHRPFCGGNQRDRLP